MSGGAVVEGARVAFWDGRRLEFAVVRGTLKGRLELFTTAKKKLRLAPERVAHRWPPADLPLGPWVEELLVAARAIDVPILWSSALEGKGAVSTATLAGWWDDEGGADLAAIVDLALLEDAIHFARKGDRWEARAPDAVDQLRAQREKEAEGAARRERWIESLRRAAAGERVETPDDPWERGELDAIERLAIEGDTAEAALVDRVRRWTERAGIQRATPSSAAFELAFAFGCFEDRHENLDLRREGLAPHFSPAVEAAADAAVVRGPRPIPEEEDWTEVETITVDDPWTREIDDAIAWRENTDGGCRVAVLIADPSRFFEADGMIEQTARERGPSIYLPDRKLPMLPAAIGERAASLVEGEIRPAFAFVFDLAADGTLLASRATPARARVDRRLDYETIDAGLAAGAAPWARPFEALDRLAAERSHRAPPVIELDEVEIRVEAGRPVTVRRPAGSASRRGVTEAMVRAGEAAGGILRDAGLPAIYRGQEPGAGAGATTTAGSEVAPTFGSSWCTARRRRMGMKRGELTNEPAPHYGLGAAAYAQATSPLRRLADLANLRQLHAALAGAEPLTAESIAELRHACEAGERRARVLERRADRYWVLE
ncbi:MAG: RNB domain-containing ribonuclease, partial [Planctomycetota bacterium]|nr:RNB domain-containing ribonuclease [Planctomycetota bacterium]